MVLKDVFSQLTNIIHLRGRCEMLKCQKCGKEYPSIGKYDSGICKECRMIFNGGPLDGMEVGDLNDNTGS